jgi:DNA-binding beta-propeller fold protein YncE
VNVGAHRSVLRSLCPLGLTMLAVLALCAGVAQAEAPKLISYGNISVGSAGVPVEGPGIAVAPVSGDVYTAGFLNFSKFTLGIIQGFNASGTPLGSSFGTGLYAGVAVDPVDGRLYVANVGSSEIDTFEPSGAPGPSFSVPSFGAIELTHESIFTVIVEIASDAAGNVYVPNVPEKKVSKYDSAGTLLQTFTGAGAHALSAPTGVAVDSAGDVWVADAHSRIEEFAPTGAFMSEIKSEGVEAVAIDGRGDVFATVENGADFCGSLEPPCAHLLEYDSSGVQVADIGAGSIGSVEGSQREPSMVAVNESTGRVYVSDGYKEVVWIYGPPNAPTVGKQLTAEVGTSEAKLGALVNAGGIETRYRFEYDTREYREGEGSHGVSVPFPEGSVGEGLAPHEVWASAGGLTPGTTYYYRVVATNALGTVVGPDRTFTTQTSTQASCPNEQSRDGFSSSLPDCRAYELVTIPNEASAEPEGGIVAARNGDRATYSSVNVQPGSQSISEDYLATRGADGWSSENALPLQSYTGEECPRFDTSPLAYSPDVSLEVFFDGGGGGAVGCDSEAVEVVSGEPLGYENLLLRDNVTGTYQLINVTPAGVAPEDASFQGASSDLSHVVFSEAAPLTAGAPVGVSDLYEWDEGVLRLVTVLPDGVTVQGALASNEQKTHAISAEGSHVFFTAGGDLYVRVDSGRTVQVDQAQGGSGPGGGGSFQYASSDGSLVFFTDDASAGLTSDTVAGSGENLYVYNTVTEELKDLTPAAHAGVGGVVGISEDGSYVYFTANGVLARGGTEGRQNLYLWQGGTSTFVATPENNEILAAEARVSPNGEYLAFASKESLTGYEQNGVPEIFMYSAVADELVCGSCNPTGEPAVHGVEQMVEVGPDGSPHYVSDNGRLFFSTREALVPRDTNGQEDVYEYEDGQANLISTGTGSGPSRFSDASEDGNDVFFETLDKLVPQDTNEEARSVYDARADGGFPEPAVSPPCATADACRAAPAPQPSIYGAPSSQTFSGAGNLAPAPAAKPKANPKAKPVKCRKSFVKRKGKSKKKAKCARKPSKKAGRSKKARKSVHTDKRTGK